MFQRLVYTPPDSSPRFTSKALELSLRRLRGPSGSGDENGPLYVSNSGRGLNGFVGAYF